MFSDNTALTRNAVSTSVGTEYIAALRRDSWCCRAIFFYPVVCCKLPLQGIHRAHYSSAHIGKRLPPSLFCLLPLFRLLTLARSLVRSSIYALEPVNK